MLQEKRKEEKSIQAVCRATSAVVKRVTVVCGSSRSLVCSGRTPAATLADATPAASLDWVFPDLCFCSMLLLKTTPPAS